MTESAGVAAPTPVVDNRYWRPMLWRAIVLAVVAVVVAFSPDHSIQFGWTVFAVVAAATAVTVEFGARRVSESESRLALRLIVVISALVTLWALYCLVWGSPVLIVTMLIWAAATGIIELVAGLRVRGRDPVSREWVASGVITMIFAIALLLVPADYSLTYEVPVKGGEPLTLVLDAPVIAVGLLGAYAALLGVYLVIAAISLRPARTVQEVAA